MLLLLIILGNNIITMVMILICVTFRNEELPIFYFLPSVSIVTRHVILINEQVFAIVILGNFRLLISWGFEYFKII